MLAFPLASAAASSGFSAAVGLIVVVTSEVTGVAVSLGTGVEVSVGRMVAVVVSVGVFVS